MKIETRIGLRYLRAKKRNGFMSFISVISVVGIALGVMTLIVVLSVMNGFQRDVRAKLFEIAPHIEMGYVDPEDPRPWQDLLSLTENRPHITARTPFVRGQGLLINAGEVRGALIEGVDAESYAPMVEGIVEAGSLKLLREGEFNIILGDLLARELAVEVGDRITMLTPQGNVTPAGMVPRLKQFKVVALVSSDVYEINAGLVLIALADAQNLFRMGDKITGIRLKTDNPGAAPEIAPTLIPEERRDDVWVRDWSYQNRTYFEAVALEKKMMFIIMALISLVASFNLVSSLVMTVNEKRSDIAILRTLGMSPGGVMHIFIIQGAVAGFFGTLIGVVAGVSIALNITPIVAGIEALLGRSLIDSQVYFLNYIPSDVRIFDVGIIAAISLTLSLLATIYPARNAAKTQPAEALRYE